MFATATSLGCTYAGAVVGTMLFSFSRLTWMYAVTAEVFALNNLMCAVLMLLVVKFMGAPSVRLGLWCAFTSGLALSNQHTSVLFVVVVALTVCIVGWRVFLNMKAVLVGRVVLFGASFH